MPVVKGGPELASLGRPAALWLTALTPRRRKARRTAAFVVALAARRSWFCYRQLFAVLLRFGRRRAGLAELAAAARAFPWTRACGC